MTLSLDLLSARELIGGLKACVVREIAGYDGIFCEARDLGCIDAPGYILAGSTVLYTSPSGDKAGDPTRVWR